MRLPAELKGCVQPDAALCSLTVPCWARAQSVECPKELRLSRACLAKARKLAAAGGRQLRRVGTAKQNSRYSITGGALAARDRSTAPTDTPETRTLCNSTEDAWAGWHVNSAPTGAGDGRRNKTIEKTILRAFRARAFSRSLGQKAKYSLRANVVRCCSDNRHPATTAPCPFGAITGSGRVMR